MTVTAGTVYVDVKPNTQNFGKDVGKEVDNAVVSLKSKLQSLGQSILGQFGPVGTAVANSFETATKSVSTLQKQSSGLHDTLSGLTTGVAGVGVALAALSVKGISAFQDVAGETRNLELQLGTTAEQASTLRAEAEALGISTQQLSTGFGIFAKNLQNGSATLEQYGLNIVKTASGQTDFQATLANIGEAFQALPPGIERTAFAMNVFGRSGKLLIPFLTESKEQLAELADNAERAGLVMSQQDVDASFKLAVTQRELSDAFQGVEVTLGRALVPALEDAGKALIFMLDTLRPLLPEIRTFGLAFLGLKGVSLILNAASASLTRLASVFTAKAAATAADTAATTENTVATEANSAAQVENAAATEASAVAAGEAAGARGLGGLAAGVGGVATAFSEAVPYIAAAGATLYGVAKAFQAINNVFRSPPTLADQLEAVAKAGGDIHDTFHPLSADMGGITSGVHGISDAVKPLALGTDQLVHSQAAFNLAVSRTGGTLAERYKTALVQINDRIGILKKDYAEGTINQDEFTKGIKELGLDQGRTNKILSHAVGDVHALSDAAAEGARKVSRFAGMGRKEFAKWAEDVKQTFQSFVEGVDRSTAAFKAHTSNFIQDLRAQKRAAEAASKDIRELGDDQVPPKFEAWLTTQGPQAIRDFVKGSTEQQHIIIQNWKDIQGATDDYNEAIDKLPKTASTKLEVDTSSADQALSNFVVKLKAAGFAITPGLIKLGGTSGTGSTNPPRGKLHEGGLVPTAISERGPANLRSDEFPAIVKKNEYVVRSDVVAQPGVLRMLEDLNRRGLKKFHDGGLVGTEKLWATISNMLHGGATYKTKMGFTPPSLTSLAPTNAAGGAWGGFKNGDIPLSALESIGRGFYLAPFAAAAFKLVEAISKTPIINNVVSAYRSLSQQAGLFARGGVVAPPGASMHGWGEAVDVTTGSPGWNAMRKFGPKGNWHWGGAFGDPPHFSYGITAQHGYHGRLPGDTLISAHQGEMVDITPKRETDWKGRDIRLNIALDRRRFTRAADFDATYSGW